MWCKMFLNVFMSCHGARFHFCRCTLWHIALRRICMKLFYSLYESAKFTVFFTVFLCRTYKDHVFKFEKWRGIDKGRFWVRNVSWISPTLRFCALLRPVFYGMHQDLIIIGLFLGPRLAQTWVWRKMLIFPRLTAKSAFYAKIRIRP